MTQRLASASSSPVHTLGADTGSVRTSVTEHAPSPPAPEADAGANAHGAEGAYLPWARGLQLAESLEGVGDLLPELHVPDQVTDEREEKSQVSQGEPAPDRSVYRPCGRVVQLAEA